MRWERKKGKDMKGCDSKGGSMKELSGVWGWKGELRLDCGELEH